MPYQSKNCVIHGHEFTDDYHDNDAFNFTHWDNDDNSIVYFIPTIEDDDKLRNQILKASPHAQIRRQIGINEMIV